MKKTLLVGWLAGLVLFAIMGRANALSLMNQNDPDNFLTINGKNYTIADQHISADKWMGALDGYKFDDYSPNSTSFHAYTGVYIGTVISSNDQPEDLLNLFGYYLGDSNYKSEFYKVEENGPLTNGPLTVTFNSGNQSGTWSTSSVSPAVLVSFYSVKGSNEYALYYVDPALQTGNWTTDHLLTRKGETPGISHLSITIDPPSPVPEPATMLLFGTGIVGLVGAYRRKKS